MAHGGDPVSGMLVEPACAARFLKLRVRAFRTTSRDRLSGIGRLILSRRCMVSGRRFSGRFLTARLGVGSATSRGETGPVGRRTPSFFPERPL
jgi:hypothetical protein